MNIPTTIVSGFLGSGKTTIISGLIDYLIEQGVKIVFIKNEIGNEDIDGKIMRGKNIKTKELLNGCICCTLVGPFIQAVDELIETQKPERIIIEASGAADPSALAMMVTSHEKLKRDGVIGVIDVVNFQGYKDLSETARRQAQFVDVIVFNKIELVDIQRKQTVVGYVRELNEFAPIVEAPKGNLHPDLAFGISSNELTRALSDDTKQGHDHSHHLETDSIDTFHCDVQGVIEKQKLEQFLHDLEPQVIRVKGFVQTEDGPMIINKVGQRVTIEKQSDVRLNESSVVCIGFRVKELEEKICKRLQNITDEKN